MKITTKNDQHLIFIREEGKYPPAFFNLLQQNNINTTFYGCRDDKRNVSFFIRKYFLLFFHVFSVLFRHNKATIVVGVHYAGIFHAIGNSVLGRKPNTIIDRIFPPYGNGVTSRIKKYVQSYGIRNSLGVVVNTEALYRDIEDLYPDCTIKEKFLIPDKISSVETLKNTQKSNAIFVGGVSGRDWDSYEYIVRSLIDVGNFIIVCPKNIVSIFSKYPNATVYTGIPVEKFNGLLANARVMLLLVKEDFLGGITVLQRSNESRTLVISNNNKHLSDYIENKVTGYIYSDLNHIISKLTRISKNGLDKSDEEVVEEAYNAFLSKSLDTGLDWLNIVLPKLNR